MEVCVDSVQSAINAQRGGATRVELCSNLFEGGTTPSIGILKVMKLKVSIPVYVMIRPRGGDFCYSEVEFTCMSENLSELKKAGADGFVFGILNEDGTVNENLCRLLIELAKPLPCTFHRAIDVTRDINTALETIISLGFGRVLTSGGESSALEGLPIITEMVKQARGRISIMPGGGITERNLHRILEGSGAKEFHGSARSSQESCMLYRKPGVPMGAALTPPEFNVKVTNVEKVNSFLDIAKNVWKS
ncbi:copper homeostasis protein cutC homolog [Mya arenaria]|uniref:copper homeostasis protein cutC homolog n=1 Tax=Mya arenaria TaxID=6604 RepID=UPI0022E14902|nr:copper homeostasis protein cutC homolog [Mya arenaria]XP_052771418.1 copper homeostasis protein cutC homolog [Mya arenaria]